MQFRSQAGFISFVIVPERGVGLNVTLDSFVYFQSSRWDLQISATGQFLLRWWFFRNYTSNNTVYNLSATCNNNNRFNPIHMVNTSGYVLLQCLVPVSLTPQQLTDTDVGRNSAHINVSNSSVAQQFFQLCVAKFLVVEKSRIRINVRVCSFVNNLTLRMDLVFHFSKHYFKGKIRGKIAKGERGKLLRWNFTFSSLCSSAPHDSWTQWAGHKICSVFGGPWNTTLSYTFAFDGSPI